MNITIDLILQISSALAALAALGGKTWNKEGETFAKRITPLGRVLTICILVIFAAGIIRVVQTNTESRIQHSKQEERQKNIASMTTHIKQLKEENDALRDNALRNLTPTIKALTALQYIQDSTKHLHINNKYDLIEVAGSYYICKENSGRIFHRFPEWSFIFRHKNKKQFYEVRVSDGRIPQQLPTDSSNTKNEGHMTYFSSLKKDYKYYRGSKEFDSVYYATDEFDLLNRNVISVKFAGPKVPFSEVQNKNPYEVLARVRVTNRPCDFTTNYIEVFNQSNEQKIILKEMPFTEDTFYSSLKAINIEKWQIDADQASEEALAQGAKGFLPGRENLGGPGIVRLYHHTENELDGLYWQLPYKIGYRPIVIDAYSKKCLAMGFSKENSTIFFSQKAWRQGAEEKVKISYNQQDFPHSRSRLFSASKLDTTANDILLTPATP